MKTLFGRGDALLQRPVPPEELARPDLRGGFAYDIDDSRDLA